MSEDVQMGKQNREKGKQEKDCLPCLQLCSDSAQKSARVEVNSVATQSQTMGRMMLA